MQGLSLRKNVSWTFTGNVIYAGGQMLVFVIMAKLLDPERVGMYVLGLAITTPVFILSNFGLRQVLATDARANKPFKHYFTLRLLMTFGALILCGAIILLGGYRGATAAVIGAIALSKSVEAISDVFYGLFQQHERLDLMARSMIIRSVLMVPAFVIGVYASGTAHWGIAGIVIAWFLVLALHDYFQGRKFLNESARSEVVEEGGTKRSFITFDRPALMSLARLAFPLAIATGLASFQYQIPRYLIEQFLGVAMLGIYAGMAYPMFALRTLVLALGQSAAPRLALLHAESKPVEFRRLLLKLVGIGLAGGIILILVVALAGRPIILFLYKPEFAAHLGAFIWIAAAGAVSFIMSFAGYGITALRLFKIVPFLNTTAILVMAGLCFWLIPIHGLVGAAWASLTADLVILPAYAGIIWYGSKRPLKEEEYRGQ